MSENDPKEEQITNGLNQEMIGTLSDFFINPELIQWEVQNYENLQIENSKVFVLSNISYWYEDKSDSISIEVNDLVQNFLFEKLISNYSANSEVIKVAISKAQAMFIIYNYPTNIPNFWTNLFEFEEEIIKHFLTSFTNETSILSINRLEPFSNIKNTMLNDGTANTILTYAFDLLQRDAPSGLQILHKFSYWCDINYISDETAMNLLQSALIQLETAPTALDVFGVVIQRLQEGEARSDLIQMICDSGKLLNIVSANPSAIDLHGAVGRMFYTVGVLTNDPLIFQCSVQLLESSIPAILAVVPFICTYISEQESCFTIQEIIEAAYNRIVSFFSDSDLTLSLYYELDQQPSAFARIIVSCWVWNSDSTSKVLEDLMTEAPNDLSKIAAQCHIMRCIMEENSSNAQKFMKDTVMDSIINIFSYVTQPFTQQILVAFDAFSRLCFDKNYHVTCFPDIYLPHELNDLLAIIFDDSTDEKSKIKFLDIFEKFSQSQCGKMPVDDSIVNTLISAGDFHYVRAGAALASCNSEYFNNSIAPMLKVLESNLNDDKNTINCLLAFLSNTSTIQNKTNLQNYFNMVYEKVTDNSESLGLFCLAVDSAYGDEAPMYLTTIIDNVIYPYSLSCFTRVIRNHIKKSTKISDENVEWFNNLINHVFNQTVSLVYICQGLNIQNDYVDECLRNTTILIKEHFNLIDNEIKGNIFDFAQQQFRRTLDSICAYECSMALLFEFATFDIKSVVDVVSPAPQNLCFAIQWDSLSPQLTSTFKVLRALINKLTTRCQEFSDILEETSKNLGLDSKAIIEFFRRETLKERAKESDRLFFQKLVLMRISSGI
ncbi:hypothetical protein TVAG_390260 [Trichomonas vaginalis G3]|uniref:Importin N-terminal domain-containing protein n=1 Tax=Trichomonas vaginalis (strain ATCC PRA-98 / G3) TaxID=412133 RepID=A2EST0_TRIV3|nr:hypothetical protein TVAGG3_0181870 [Trichomonas vaginalis G3]EAY04256.1 hypothetical protein TVAG_390260 [Trichomonas vaginalis G3]KAI5549349.1 hypothetical protein TVAGG3_0181870 [Trichomonas vaginalis G3]|eukprot:XP_001316479.1 hypothetical protein [Trichomonas vaginalis G3]